MSYTQIVLHLAFLVFAGAPALIRALENKGDSNFKFAFDENEIKNSTKFFIHTKEHPEGIEFSPNEKSPHFKTNTSTKFLVHGYFRTGKEILQIVKEYLNEPGYSNVVTFSWEFVHSMPYLTAAKAANFIGNSALAKDITKIGCKHTLYPDHIHFIGYNLGAHLVGAAARKLGLKIRRITGLDPARRCFEVPCDGVEFSGLSKNDATFVDVMHTNAHIEGFSYPIGTVDFFPNGGTFQPACNNQNNPNCNSIMSLKYFAESIGPHNNFLGLHCSSQIKFLNCDCKGSRTITWNDPASAYADVPSGSFYFKTKATSPYGMGVKGISPKY